MKSFIIILSEIPNKDCDAKFAEYIDKNKFEFWRHTSLNWILVTPDNVDGNMINLELKNAYGLIFICVLTVQLEGFAGHYIAGPSIANPFQWFYDIYKNDNFVPKWEKIQEDETDLDDDGQIGLILE